MEYRKKQRLYFIILLVNLFLVIGVSVAIFFISKLGSTVWLVFVGLMVYLAFSSLFINSYLYFYQLKHQFYTLRVNAKAPIPIQTDPLGKSFTLKRDKEGYKDLKSYGNFYLQHRYINDKSSRFHRMGALEVIVYITNPKLAFDHPSVIEKINLIEDDITRQRQFIHRYYIYAIKETDALTDEQKSEANMVQFSSAKKRHLTSINLYYIKPEQQAYFLHSDTYAPNAYYQYAVSQIQSWLK
ncbi:MAG: hypothetical protein WC225_04990 [Acholeplasmataceae bacterium]|nr:hypothetical protein [Acholeplasmataceae bacterium]